MTANTSQTPARAPFTHPSQQIEHALLRVHHQLHRYLQRRPWPRNDDPNPLRVLEPERRWLNPSPHAEALVEHHQVGRARAEASIFEGLELPLDRLQTAFSLSALELDFFVASIAWQVDEATGRAYRFAWNDYNRREPTVGFLIDLVADNAAQAAELRHMLRRGPLLRQHLLASPAPLRPDLPVPTLIEVRVYADERMLTFALGDKAPPNPDMSLEPAAEPDSGSDPALVLDPAVEEELTRFPLYLRASRQEMTPVLLIGPQGSGRRSIARKLAHTLSLPLLIARLAINDHLADALHLPIREAKLSEALLLLLLEGSPNDISSAAGERLRECTCPCIVSVEQPSAHLDALLGLPPSIDLRAPSVPTRHTLWLRALSPHVPPDLTEGLARTASVALFPPAAIERALTRARNRRRWLQPQRHRAHITADDLHCALRLERNHKLHTLADLIEVRGQWSDLILTEDAERKLEDVIHFAQHRRYVLDVWRLRDKVGYGTGLSVLFSGPPGTGKTFAAGLIAQRLGAELYRVDLSQIVSKWIGETEKNLAKIFEEAQRAEAILLFDEADSLFAARTGVSSSTDRYANLEVNFLLQRMENYEGMTILTTNFEAAIDDAFMRRLRFNVPFPAPKPAQRAALWANLLPSGAPISDDIDFEAIGEDYELSGGSIKNSILRACVRAASLSSPITEALLRDSAVRESSEQGFLVRDGAARKNPRKTTP